MPLAARYARVSSTGKHGLGSLYLTEDSIFLIEVVNVRLEAFIVLKCMIGWSNGYSIDLGSQTVGRANNHSDIDMNVKCDISNAIDTYGQIAF